MSEQNRFYEADIKELVRSKKHIFAEDEITSADEDIRIFNEKVICQGKCRTDVLVLDRNGTVLGIEIKTERDSTQRLNSQLHYYSQVCKYVYVMCHDKHVEKTEKILKRYKHNHVGIISYVEFKGTPIIGKYKKATPSPFRSPYHTLNILWKQSLLIMLKHIRDPITFMTGVNYNKGGRYSGGGGNFSGTTQTRRMNKVSIINQIVKYLGEENTYKLFTRVVIYGYNNKWKILEEDFFNVVKNGVRTLNER